MLARFCLYGFLKNQRYFEPFWMLAFLDKGVSFFGIGVLYAVRDVTVNLLEIPSGAVADLFGRRRAMVLAFLAYFACFGLFAFATSYAALCAGMVLLALGEAFRSGTHKALIFTWLTQQGRADEKTRIYGVTRSWSKYGSALSALIAAGLVFATADYAAVFLWSLVPCGLNVVNLWSYPRSIDPLPGTPRTVAGVWTHLRGTLGEAIGRRDLRGLIGEAMGFEGSFRAAKDYLQPALVAAAVLWFGTAESDAGSNALLIGAVYFVLFLAAAAASRRAHSFVERAGSVDAGARHLWTLVTLAFGSIALASSLDWSVVLILGFVAVHVLQNLWRPIMTSRIYSLVDPEKGATVLSVESQANRIATVVLAPLFGWLVDGAGDIWPVFVIAAGIALAFRIGRSR